MAYEFVPEFFGVLVYMKCEPSRESNPQCVGSYAKGHVVVKRVTQCNKKGMVIIARDNWIAR